MKKILLLTTVLCFTALTATEAQYSVNKTKYDYRTYVPEVGDPYNPGVAGLASFFIPGLGQMISNEGGRGAGFLAGYAGCWVLYGVGVGSAVNDIAMDGYSDGSGAVLMVLGAGGALVVGIWSIVDAVRVAKVNNMAWRDRDASSSSLMIAPSIGLTPENKAVPPVTASLRF